MPGWNGLVCSTRAVASGLLSLLLFVLCVSGGRARCLADSLLLENGRDAFDATRVIRNMDISDMNGNRRRLRQEVEPGAAVAGSDAAGPKVGLPIEIESSVQLCMPYFNTYFFPFLEGNRQVVDPITNLKASSKECCASCLENPKCNAWQWCPVEIGCSFENTTASSAVSNTSFPYLGCQLLDLEGFSKYVYNLTGVLSKGENVPFIAGAPLNVSIVDVAGYDEYPGNELGSQFDFQCDLNGDGGKQDLNESSGSVLRYNSSTTFGCMVSGDQQTVAEVCSGIGEQCVGFNYYGKEFDPTGALADNSIQLPFDGPVGVLKTGENIADSFLAEVDLNPNSVLYIKAGLLPDATGGLSGGIPLQDEASAEANDGGNNTVVIVVVSVVVGLLVILGLVVMFYYIKRYQQMTRSFPSPPISMNSTPQIGRSPLGSASKPGPFGTATLAIHETYPGTRKFDRNSSDELTSTDQDVAASDSPPSLAPAGPWPYSAQMSQNNMNNGGIVVTELSLPKEGMVHASGGSSGPSSAANGTSARDLMDAFSQMYMKRPALDYAALGSLQEDEEVRAVQALEAAVESSRRSGTSSPSRSAKIPSLIRDEATGLEHAGLADDWSILPEEVEVCRRPDGTWWQLGTGGFGTVYRGLYHGIHPVAIKIIHQVDEDRHKDAFIREASLLKALRHKNVVQFLGASLDGPQGTALLVTELMELGDLWRALSAKNENGERLFSWYQRGAQCVIDVASGLHYLHTKRVVHFDLKSANILLSKAGTAKLADIGMARVLNKSHLSIISGLGTFAWSAPEVLAGRRCTEKADIYSLGIVLWEICTGEAPARGDMRAIHAPDDCPQAIVDLYERCIKENPDDRPSALECLEILTSV
jgi:hypothetical protein